VVGQSASHGTRSHAISQHQATTGMENPRCEVSTTPAHEESRAQKAGKTVATEPHIPEVFKNEKAGKMKVDEGRSSEADDKPFGF
jgi:hypothetical protein